MASACSPLSAVTTVRQASGPEYIQRFNLYRAAEITGTKSAYSLIFLRMNMPLVQR